MARPNEAVLCPACGARNKGKWEFCARCGESLQGAASAVSASAPRKGASPKGVSRAADDAFPRPSPWNTALAGAAILALLAAVTTAVWYARKQGPAPLPDPAAFTFPTTPAQPKAVEVKPGSPGEKAFQEGIRRLRAGDIAGALPLLAQAVDEAPTNSLYQWTYGEGLHRSGDTDGSLAALAEAARLAPERYRLDYVKFLGVAGRSAQAAAEFEAMLEASPDDSELLRGAGWYLCQQRNFAKGLPLLRRAAELRETDVAVQQQFADMAASSGGYADAALGYGQVVLLEPGNHGARAKLADMLRRQGKTEQAVEALRKGISLDPNAAELQRGLGGVLEQAGRPQEAAAAYREYARLAPEAADAASLREKADRLAPVAGGGS